MTKVKGFLLSEKLKAEHGNKGAQVASKRVELEAVKLSVQKIEDEYKEAVLSGKSSEELDGILDKKAEAETKLSRRSQELTLIEGMGVEYSETAESFAASFAQYASQVKKETLSPIISKIETAKENYLKALNELEQELSVFKTEQDTAQGFLNVLEKGNNIHHSLSSLGLQEEKSRFLNAQDFAASYYNIFK